MDILLRESSFGRLLNLVSNGRLFTHHDLDIPKHEETTSSSSSTCPGDARHILVDFSGPEDPDMPRNWPTLAKTVVMVDVMLLNFSFYAASAIFTPSIPGIEEVFGATTAEGTLGLSLFVIAYGIGPLILSPLSSLPSIGRTPVYVLGCLAFCLFNIGTALAKNLHTILILRFFSGFIGSAPISVGGATLMEVYGPTEIPYAIALYAVSGVCGPILGPILGTLAIERWKTWTATLWLLSGVTAFTTVFIFFLLPETLYSNILLRRAQRLRNQTGNPSYQSQADIDTPESNLAIRIVRQTIDDFKLSCMDPVIIFVNMHTMLIYGILYLWFEFFPFVFDGIYHFTAIQQGLAFFGILVGAVVSVIVYVLWLYFSYQPRVAKPDAIVEPEARLVPGQVGAICIPVCLFMFAWTSRESVHWIVPIIGTAFFAPGFYLTFQSILNYLGESYPRYVASVFAGNTFFRSSFGGALPLAAPRMLQSLGIGWASSTLGFISIAMVPLPFILERYGKRLRSWSKYAN
ncbi:major facilitator superfamily domain-containing protein [Aspergillus caelatus]|uniref:Major facilitator superfamily domain-containing protein n=1 Tax=Aspergillus caelatus TaxID=61420 RepID=A0A5N7AD05_9EURO|nr:major facilitator superfamily domain-containing protein [Aspergillus caelatus]KAE8366520.1 major facilitator superfamily domain-containing protein [Aspergillus caelatus]